MKIHRLAIFAVTGALIACELRAADCVEFQKVFDDRDYDFESLKGAFDSDIGEYRSVIKLPGSDSCSIQIENDKNYHSSQFSCQWRFPENAREKMPIYRDDLINSVKKCIPNSMIKEKPRYFGGRDVRFPTFSQRLVDDFEIRIRDGELKNKYKGNITLTLWFILEKVTIE